MNAGWGIGMLIAMLLVGGLIAFIVVALLKDRRTVAANPTGQASLRAAEQILAERMAHGEIDPAEYQLRLSALKRSR